MLFERAELWHERSAVRSQPAPQLGSAAHLSAWSSFSWPRYLRTFLPGRTGYLPLHWSMAGHGMGWTRVRMRVRRTVVGMRLAEHESTGAAGSAAVRRSAARDNRGDRRGGPCPAEEPRDPNVAIQPSRVTAIYKYMFLSALYYHAFLTSRAPLSADTNYDIVYCTPDASSPARASPLPCGSTCRSSLGPAARCGGGMTAKSLRA